MKKQLYQSLIDYIRTERVPAIASSRGWGSLKELFLPIDDLTSWTKTDLESLDLVKEFHAALREVYGEQEGKRVLNSIKNSLLTSFYTEPTLIDAIITPIADREQDVERILEPAAGTGNFIPSLLSNFPDAQITAIEKDFLSAKMLSGRYPEITTVHSPFEEDKSKGYDLITSNIPFGAIQVYDADFVKERNPIKVKSTTRIHNYFPVKSLDKLNEGGVIAFITSSGFSDSPGNTEIRKYLMEQASLVDVIRLPDHALASSGTRVSTDIVILKKDSKKKITTDREKDFISTSPVTLNNAEGEKVEVSVNSYLQKRPNKVLGELVSDGQYGNNQAVAKSKDDINEISRKVSQTITAAYEHNDGVKIERLQEKEQEDQPQLMHGRVLISEDTQLHPLLQNGNLIVYEGKAGRYYMENGVRQFEHVPVLKDIPRVSAIIGVRDAYKSLFHSEINNSDPAEIEQLRAKLNDTYAMMSWQFGALNEAPIILSEDAEDHVMIGLEVKDGKGWKKADVFTMSTLDQATEMVAKLETLDDAILYSLNATGRLDAEVMAGVLESTADQVLEEGLRDGKIYLAPIMANDVLDWQPQTAEEYLSGNMVEKLERFENIKDHYPAKFAEFRDEQHAALKRSVPEAIPFDLIGISLGERWIPEDVYSQFASEIFKVPTTVVYAKGSDTFNVQLQKYSPENVAELSVTTKDGRKLRGEHIFLNAIANTSPTITYEIRDGEGMVKRPDVDAMRMVEDKIKFFREEFSEFLNRHHGIQKDLERLYNEKFNNIRLREYDGSHLELKQVRYFTPLAHQRDAVWMQLQLRGGLVDHIPGAGKTLVFIMAAMEMRRLKMARKPLVIAMKANAHEIYTQDFMKAYPEAKVLFPKDDDFTPSKRKEFFAKMMNNDWDCVVMTHEQFKRIPPDASIVDQTLKDEINALEDDLLVLTGRGGASKRQYKGLENRKAKLEADLKEKKDSIQRDELPDFKQLGFDHLFIDESHQFKNLTYTTRHSQVSGLGTPEGSQRALNLLMASRSLQKRHGGDKGVSFFSGTPISNSLVELYLLFKYLRPNALAKQGINSFDAWAAVYAEKSSEYEFNITGEIKRKERFRQFVKVQELSKFYREIAHVVTEANFPVPKPRVNNIAVTIPPTPAQENYIQDLLKFVSTKDGSWINQDLTENGKGAYMLLATGLATKMSLDMRLLYPQIGFEKGCKLDVASDNIVRIHNKFSHVKGTQLVFCDIGTPRKDGGFSAYSELKRLLVEKGIPESKIQFIHDHDSSKTKKRRLFQQVNEGGVNIMVGSTQKMGTGVNVQKNVVAMHHLDLPWRPADNEQRNARGGRQGNEVARDFNDNKVDTYTYAVDRSLDAYKASTLDHKARMITQFKTASMDVRRIDEGAISEDGAMNMAELTALLSGNQDLLVRAKVNKELQDLESKYMAYSRERSTAQREIEMYDETIGRAVKVLDHLKKDLAYRTEFESAGTPPKPEKGDQARYHYPQPVVVKDFRLLANSLTKFEVTERPEHDPKVIGEAIHKALFTIKVSGMTNDQHVIATYGEFQLTAQHGNIQLNRPSSMVKYSKSEGEVNANPVLAGRFIVDALNKMPNMIAGQTEKLEQYHQVHLSHQRKLEKEFTGRERIFELREQLASLDAALANQDIMSAKEHHIPTHVKYRLPRVNTTGRALGSDSQTEIKVEFSKE